MIFFSLPMNYRERTETSEHLLETHLLTILYYPIFNILRQPQYNRVTYMFGAAPRALGKVYFVKFNILPFRTGLSLWEGGCARIRKRTSDENVWTMRGIMRYWWAAEMGYVRPSDKSLRGLCGSQMPADQVLKVPFFSHLNVFWRWDIKTVFSICTLI